MQYLTVENQQLLTNAIKDKVQRDADQAHRNAGRWGLICAATGVGKSKIAINMVEKLVTFKPDAKILLVVPTQSLRDTGWRDEFVQWGQHSTFTTNVIKVCYKSLAKFKDQVFDLVILDECHNLSEAQSTLFKKNEVKGLVGLTATKPKKLDKIAIFESVGLNLVYEITLDEAVDLGIVAPYQITVVRVPLESRVKNVLAGAKEKPFMVTEASNYDYFRKVEEKERNQGKAPSQSFFLKRMRFIYNLRSKTEAARTLLAKMKEEERIVIFSGSCEQADELSECRYHSKTDDVCYTQFRNREINRLSCVNSVNEGHNLPLVDLGLVVQINSNDLHIIQRIGRFIRYRPNHTGRLVILAAENTIDERWVREALQELNQSRITYVNYVDILLREHQF